MAITTVTLVAPSAANGPVYFDEVTVLGDASYAAGGTTGLKARMRAITSSQREPLAVIDQGNTAFVINYDHANEKLVVRNKADGLEVTGNQSAVTYKLLVISK